MAHLYQPALVGFAFLAKPGCFCSTSDAFVVQVSVYFIKTPTKVLKTLHSEYN